MIQFIKNLLKGKQTCFACVVIENDMQTQFSYEHTCGKPGKTTSLIPELDKKTFDEWAKNPSMKSNNSWSCKNCGSTTNAKSTMDSSLCDSCWHTTMAATFTSTAFL